MSALASRKRKVIVIIDEYFRYEEDYAISKEKAAKDIKVLEKKLCTWPGPPRVLGLDVSGPHLSIGPKNWATAQGAVLGCVPRAAHRPLAIWERSHAVHLAQLLLYR